MAQDVRTQFGGRAFAITASDATVYTTPTAVYVGVAGTVVCQPYDNATADTVTFTMQSGSVVPVLVRRVLAASTATGLIGLT